MLIDGISTGTKKAVGMIFKAHKNNLHGHNNCRGTASTHYIESFQESATAVDITAEILSIECVYHAKHTTVLIMPRSIWIGLIHSRLQTGKHVTFIFITQTC